MRCTPSSGVPAPKKFKSTRCTQVYPKTASEMTKLHRCSKRVVHLVEMCAWNGQSQQGVQEEYHQIFKVQQVCQGCIHLQYICLSCVSGVHLTLHLFCRCTTEVVLLQQGVLLGSLWGELKTFYLLNMGTEKLNHTCKIFPSRANSKKRLHK